MSLLLRKHRHIRKISQEKLAQLSGVGHGTISRIERRVTRNIDEAIAFSICAALRVSLKDVAEFKHLADEQE